jgi:hypothetical protein
MSAGHCGKRVGFEEMFGSSSPTSCSAAKRVRRSGSGSDFGSGSEDSVAGLLQMFPDLDPEVRFNDELRSPCRFFSYSQIPC